MPTPPHRATSSIADAARAIAERRRLRHRTISAERGRVMHHAAAPPPPSSWGRIPVGISTPSVRLFCDQVFFRHPLDVGRGNLVDSPEIAVHQMVVAQHLPDAELQRLLEDRVLGEHKRRLLKVLGLLQFLGADRRVP